MDSVDQERKLQNRVIKWLVDDLGYTYLGNLEDIDNKPLKKDLLEQNLTKRGYDNELIRKAIAKIETLSNNQTDSLYAINKEIYSILRYGMQGIRDDNNKRITVNYIDWKNVENNDFYVAEEVSVVRFDGHSRKRPDLVLYINGIALGVFELKRSSVSVGEGIRQLLQNQKRENILSFFSTAQLLFAGNEAEGLSYGTINTPEKFYLKWKEDPKATDALSQTIKVLQSTQDNRLRDGVIAMCHKERFLSLIYDFIIFDAGIKKTCRHNQYFANIAARNYIKQDKGGIIWNTQGSGKSLIMVWLTKWIIENINNSRVVIITDRDELDEQIESLYFNVGENVYRTKSCNDLRDVLNKSEQNIVCSLIHKYGHNAGSQADIDLYRKELLANLPPNFRAKGNIIAFIDECHRTNSGKLHEAVRTLMPEAIIIGFTGTPLLKKDKKSSREIFGDYIHTYKFDEGVKDGVVLDLRYEARDVDQDLSSREKVDMWFENKTKGLTDKAKEQLKQRWTSINHLYSSKQRLEKIANDIYFDMTFKARLKKNTGTAMLVAGSIYEACRYWDIFTNMGFDKCAVVTSYEPSAYNVRTATANGEEEYKNKIYERMLQGKKVDKFEEYVKKQFKENPAQMKLLIVVDKLLTGFDAPSATYLYIDKSMRDHDLFQAICRVNRPDGDDKDYGYIVDYKDLFRNIELAVNDYTSGAFEDYDEEDINGLIKGRYDAAKAEMDTSLSSLSELFENIDEPKADTDYIAYFCNGEQEEIGARRDVLYCLTSSATRSFGNCCDKLVSDYKYTEADLDNLRRKIAGYNKIKDMIKLASCDYIDLKPYEVDMRYILDTFIRAEDSKVISQLGDLSLVDLLIKEEPKDIEILIDGIPGDKNAKAETIENNIKHEIVKKSKNDSKYFALLSERLDKIIQQRKEDAISYAEYLQQLVELAKAAKKPEEYSYYPDAIKNSVARMFLYDYFNNNEDIVVAIDECIRRAIQPGWKENLQKQRRIQRNILNTLLEKGYSEENAMDETKNIFDQMKCLEEYDVQ